MMSLNQETAKRFIGKHVKFQDEDGNWVVGRLAKADDEAIYVEVYNETGSETDEEEGYGYGVWGPRRGFVRGPRRTFYRGPRGSFYRGPRGGFVRGGGYGRYPYPGVIGLTLLPFLFW